MALQGKLLRAIETGEFCRAGSADTQKADIQVIAATHEDLRALADAGRFRQDLLYRLKGFEISMPPLRAIPGDIASLSENFLHAARAAGRIRVQGIADSVIECLCAYRFPGNVRELRAIIERAAVIAQARSSWFIEEQDLPKDVREAGHPASAVAITWNGQGPIQIDRELARAELGMHQIALAASMGRKQHAASLVGLPHRHSLPRRVARLRRDFPEVLAEFPEIGRQFAANGADPEGNES
jgi:DNA-binding NtrC family response regulator